MVCRRSLCFVVILLGAVRLAGQESRTSTTAVGALVGSAVLQDLDAGAAFLEALDFIRKHPADPGVVFALRRLDALEGLHWDPEAERSVLAEARARLLAGPRGEGAGLLESALRDRAKRVALAMGDTAPYAELRHDDGIVKAVLGMAGFGPKVNHLHDAWLPIDGMIDTDQVYPAADGREGVSFEVHRASVADGAFDFFRTRSNFGFACAVAQIRSPAPRAAVVEIQCTSSFRLRVNGVVAMDCDRYRDRRPRTQAAAVTLQEGWNRIVIRFSDAGKAGFRLRVADRNGFADGEFVFEEGRVLHPAAGAKADGTAPEMAPVLLPWQRLEAAGRAGDARALAAAAALLSREGLEPEGLRLAEEALEAAPADPVVKLQVAHHLMTANYLPESHCHGRLRTITDALLAADPGNRQARLLDAQLLERDGKVLESLAALVALREEGRVLPLLEDRITVTAAAAGLWMERDAALARWRSLGTLSPALIDRLAPIAWEEGRVADYRSLMEARVALDLDGPAVRDVAWDALWHRDMAVAGRLIAELAEWDPDSVEPGLMAATLDLRRGLVAAAVARLRALAEAHPEFGEALNRLAETLYASGDDAGALEAWRRSLAQNPDPPEVRRILLHLAPDSWDPFEEFAMDPMAVIRDGPGAREFPEAASVLLLDQTVVRIRPDGAVEREIHQIYRILDRRGIESLSRVDLLEDVIEARTILPDGTILEPISVEDGRCTMPGLAPGVAVEMKHRTVDSPPAGDPFELGAFFFQDPDFESPFHMSRYVVVVPEGFDVQIRPRHFSAPPEILARGHERVHVFVMKDTPRVEVETFMPGYREIIPHVVVANPDSHVRINHLYRGYAIFATAPTPAVYRTAAEVRNALPAEQRDDAAVARALHDFVRTTITTERGEVPPEATLIERVGDRLRLYMSLLRAADIPFSFCRTAVRPDLAEPADLELVRADRFDIPIVRVEPRGGAPVFAMFTSRYMSFGRLPHLLSGSPVFVTGPAGGRIETLPASDPEDELSEDVAVEMDLEADGTAVARCAITAHGTEAALLKDALARGNRDLERRLFSQAAASIFAGHAPRVTDFAIRGGAAVDEPLVVGFTCDVRGLLAGGADGVQLEGLLTKLDMTKTYVGSPRRTQPFVFRDIVRRRLHVRVNLPPGLSIRRLPEPLLRSGFLGDWSVAYTPTRRGFEVRRDVHFAPTRFEAGVWGAFMTFCREIDAREAEPVELGPPR